MSTVLVTPGRKRNVQNELHFKKHNLLHLLILCVESSIYHYLNFKKHGLLHILTLFVGLSIIIHMHFKKHGKLHLLTLFVGASVQHLMNWQPIVMLNFAAAAVYFAVIYLDLSLFYNIFWFTLVHNLTQRTRVSWIGNEANTD